MARYMIIFVAFILTSCTGFNTAPPITDHTTRSTVYGWVDISDVAGNRLTNVQLRQYAPATEFPFYNIYFEKFAGGYVFAGNGLPNGAFKIDNLQLMSCLSILCGNTINQYDFSSQGGGFGSLNISRPGAHFIGNFKLNTEQRTGMFRQGTFSFERARSGPSRKQILRFLMENAPSDHAIYNQRIRAAYNRL